jgi:hypothetical protein
MARTIIEKVMKGGVDPGARSFSTTAGAAGLPPVGRRLVIQLADPDRFVL